MSTSRKATTAPAAGTTAIEPADGDTGGTLWDAPNQQVVRADQSAPWEEGTGGQAIPKADAAPAKTATASAETTTSAETSSTEPASE